MPADISPDRAHSRTRTVLGSTLNVSEAAAACQPRRLHNPPLDQTEERLT